MTTFAVGDVQGCFDELQRLLKKARFNPSKDMLWFLGDLVQRGPKSLETLRYAKSLDGHAGIILGNHDLHLLAVHYGIRQPKAKDQIEAVLDAPDREELMDWLRKQRLLGESRPHKVTMVHAGLAPQWSLGDARKLAVEVEQALQAKKPQQFLEAMYGDTPDLWSPKLKGLERLRTITNYFTRMRICDGEGRLDLVYNQGPENIPADRYPWFRVPNRKSSGKTILFGHWAALMGKSGQPDAIAMDTGCVWGGPLSMIRLDDMKIFQVPAISTSTA